MGFNTVLFINNDCLGEIKRNPEEFAEKLIQHCNLFDRETFSIGHQVNAAKVVACEHADCTVMIAAGQNSATLIGSCMDQSHHNIEDRVALMKRIAKTYGYRLELEKIR